MNAAAKQEPGANWLFYLLLMLIVWLPIPYGSNVEWATAVFGVAVYFLLGIWLILAMLGRVRIPRALASNRWIFLIWLCWLTWISFQLLPVSPGALEVLSPYAASIARQAFPGGIPAARPISIAPEKTYHALTLTCSYLALYLLVILTACSRDRLRLLAGTLVLSGLLQAVFGSLMVMSGLEYGFLIKKTAYLGSATGTFINRNHFAGYMELCGATGVGLVITEMKRNASSNWRVWVHDFSDLIFSRKLRIRVFVGVMVIALVITHSRMGNTAFFAALVVCGPVYVLLSDRKMFLRSLLLFASFLIVDLLIVSNWFGLEEVARRVETTQENTETRAYLFPELANTIEHYRLTGSGLGTFSTAALPFRYTYPEHFYNHAHNDYAEFCIETGVVGLSLLALLVLSTALHALRVMASRQNRLRVGVAFGGLMAMCAIAIHSTVDFNLQIPANAATMIVILAMVNSCSQQSRTRQIKVKSDQNNTVDDRDDPVE